MKLRNRSITPRLASATLIALLSVMSLTSCTDTQIADSFTVAESALQSTAAILQPVNPSLALGIGIAGKAVQDAYNTWTIYASAPASDKATAAGKAQVAILAAQQNLAAILADARVKNPETVGYITAYVTVANTVLTLILRHLPAPVVPKAVPVPAVAGLPIVRGARSVADLKRYFNDQMVQAGHGEAVIS